MSPRIRPALSPPTANYSSLLRWGRGRGCGGGGGSLVNGPRAGVPGARRQRGCGGSEGCPTAALPALPCPPPQPQRSLHCGPRRSGPSSSRPSSSRPSSFPSPAPSPPGPRPPSLTFFPAPLLICSPFSKTSPTVTWARCPTSRAPALPPPAHQEQTQDGPSASSAGLAPRLEGSLPPE